MNAAEALRAVTGGNTLSTAQAETVMGDIMDGNVASVHIAGLLCALKTREESTHEIVGFARAMRARMVRVPVTGEVIDTCGTGGDTPKNGLGTFNVSTAAALIAASAGARVAKHGNRSASSRCGSSDVLEALGVNLDLPPERIAHCIETLGIGFMFAPAHHPAMKHVAPVRKELGIRTVFNLLGPLCNPAGAQSQVMGVPEEKWLRPIASALRELGTRRALVLHSRDGLDEISTCAPTDYIELRDGKLYEGTINPHDYGEGCAHAEALQGGDAPRNAEIISQLLHDADGPPGEVACLNAGAILWIAGISPDLSAGVQLARAAVNAGESRELLARLIEFTNRYVSATTW